MPEEEEMCTTLPGGADHFIYRPVYTCKYLRVKFLCALFNSHTSLHPLVPNVAYEYLMCNVVLTTQSVISAVMQSLFKFKSSADQYKHLILVLVG
jgi:hypothetical protein